MRKFDKNCLHSLPGFYGFVGKKSIAFYFHSFLGYKEEWMKALGKWQEDICSYVHVRSSFCFQPEELDSIRSCNDVFICITTWTAQEPQMSSFSYVVCYLARVLLMLNDDYILYNVLLALLPKYFVCKCDNFSTLRCGWVHNKQEELKFQSKNKMGKEIYTIFLNFNVTEFV